VRKLQRREGSRPLVPIVDRERVGGGIDRL